MNRKKVIKLARKIIRLRKDRKTPFFYFAYRLKYAGMDVQDLLANTHIFFILGTGRSGTQWLSSFLDMADNALVLHEPAFYYDIGVMEKSKNSKSYAYKYIRNFRRYFIYEKIRESRKGTYGEVTGTLRYHAQALHDIFPESSIFLLTRDGRDVIRSIWQRPAHYNERSGSAYNLKPQPGELYFDEWMDMSRFDKLCWSWMHANEFMLSCIPLEYVVHFEDIIGDYNYIQNKILNPLALEISKEKWQEAVNHKSRNASNDYTFPHWNDWSLSDKKTFLKICGPTMEKLGYDMNW